MASEELSNYKEVEKQVLKQLEAASKALAETHEIMADERMATRSTFSRALTASLGLNAAFLGVVVWLASPEVIPLVLQKGSQGELRQIAASNRTFYELDEIKDFASRRFLNLHNWSYKNYLQHFEDERAYWDEKALGGYVSAVAARGDFKEAERLRKRFDAVMISPIKILQQVPYKDGYKVYRVQMLLEDEAVDIRGVSKAQWSAVMDIREVPPEEGGNGLEIIRFDEVAKRG